MDRKVVYCSACDTYYEERAWGGRFPLNDNEVTEEEKIVCMNPLNDLASYKNNQETCGCRTPVRVPKDAAKHILPF